jgi:arylsulfatase A
MPSTMFKGKSGLGYRGDAILQLDWTVGEILQQLKLQGIADNTIVIFSSDNGPVLDDGYQDEAVTQLNGHTPWGIYRGGKYSSYEAGTRVPMLISWPGKIKSQVSNAMICQIDLLASFAKHFNIKIPNGHAEDSENMLNVLFGKSSQGRTVLIEQGFNSIAIVNGNWKYIEPNNHDVMNELTNTELGNNPLPQLFNLKTDAGEKNNVAAQNPDMVKQLADLLKQIREKK